MIAYVTSIGEPTTDLCVWSLERQELDVIVIKGKNSLGEKLKYIYNHADEDFIRVDADVIVTHPPVINHEDENWWFQWMTYDMYKFQPTYGGVHHIRKEALPALRANIDKFIHDDRPETRMWNLPEFNNPRRCSSANIMVGIHGFGQRDIDRVEKVKRGRKYFDDYDFDLARKMQEFYK